MKSPAFRLDQTNGHFPFRACRADRRFSYGVYAPSSYARETAASHRLLVAVHGSERAPEVARALCVDLAERTKRLVLAPLFPVAMTEADEFHNYIFLQHGGVRYDEVLLAMVDEVAERFAVPLEPLWLAGFSGGGQFVHRFMYLHAARLAAVSVGAPGIVNTLDAAQPWPIGVKDLGSRFGREVDMAALRRLRVQVVVGGQDTGTDIVIRPGDPLFAEGVNDSGPHRVARAGFLRDVLVAAGVDARLDVVPGAGHLASDVQAAVDGFFLGLG